MSTLKAQYPQYTISKNKIQLEKGMDIDAILAYLEKAYSMYKIDRTDGLKVIMQGEWIHMRRSNTEPIIRIYTESNTEEQAEKLANEVQNKVNQFLKQ